MSVPKINYVRNMSRIFQDTIVQGICPKKN